MNIAIAVHKSNQSFSPVNVNVIQVAVPYVFQARLSSLNLEFKVAVQACSRRWQAS